MDWYTSNLCLMLISLSIMIVSISLNSGLTKKKKFYSILLSSFVMACGLCEWVGVQVQKLEFNEHIKNIHILVKFFEFSLAPFIGVIPGLIFRKDNHKLGVIEYTTLSLLGVNVIFEIISCFTGIIFKVNGDNSYTHGVCYFIYYIAYGVGILYFIYTSIKAFRKRDVKYLIPNYLVVLFVLTGVFIHVFNEDIRIEWITIGISLILIYKFYGDVLSNTDGLTDLLNRFEFENTIKNLSSKSEIIYFDINNFKQANDTYGHLYGDEVLKKVSTALIKVYGKFGKIYRYGGDEFCVIVHKHHDKVPFLNEQFSKLIDEYISLDDKFPNISFGEAHFDPSKDKLSAVLDKADESMYKRKKEMEEK